MSISYWIWTSVEDFPVVGGCWKDSAAPPSSAAKYAFHEEWTLAGSYFHWAYIWSM
jgi:hypothetical protein